MLIRHRPETQTLYAQLYELVAAHELDLVGGFANGLPVEREVRGRMYLYWQLRDVGGKLRQIYLGPAADTRARELRDALAAYKGRRGPIVEDLERLTAAYVASGGPRHLGQHFRVVDALARAGLFRAGVLLVGSHAFVGLSSGLSSENRALRQLLGPPFPGPYGPCRETPWARTSIGHTNLTP